MKTSCGGSLVVKNLNEQHFKKEFKIGGDDLFASAVHNSVMTTVTTSFSRSGITSGSRVIVNSDSDIGVAYRLIMDNKKFKNSFS